MDKKIILCCFGDVKNPRTWSGTPLALFNGLSEAKLLKDTIDYSIENNIKYLLPKIAGKIAEGFFYRRRDTRDFFTSKSYEKNLLSHFKTKGIPGQDVMFHICEYCVPPQLVGKVKNVAYLDATLKGVMEFGLNRKRLFKKYMDWYHSKNVFYLEGLDYIFTMNEWSRQSLIKDYDIHGNKIKNVGFGVNLQPYFGPKDYTNKEMLIVLKRGWEKLKGLDLLLQAFHILTKKDDNVKLHVVGTTYKQQVGVEYYENFPRNKTIELFQKCSLYVMPALAEVNGITYLEGLANKAPIMGLNRYAFPEFSGYGKYGFIVNKADKIELADKIEFALNNPKILEQMGREGQIATIERYNWNKVIKEIVGTIETVL